MIGGPSRRWTTGATMRGRRLDCWNVANFTIPPSPSPHRLHRTYVGNEGSSHCNARGRIPGAPLYRGGGIPGTPLTICRGGGVPSAYERGQRPTVSRRGVPPGTYVGTSRDYTPGADEWDERSTIPNGCSPMVPMVPKVINLR